MEILTIKDKIIENDNIKTIFWSFDISNEYVESYEIQGILEVEEELKYTNDDSLIQFLETKLNIQGFKNQCYLDLGIEQP